jgi:hypothetical protein
MKVQAKATRMQIHGGLPGPQPVAVRSAGRDLEISSKAMKNQINQQAENLLGDKLFGNRNP